MKYDRFVISSKQRIDDDTVSLYRECSVWCGLKNISSIDILPMTDSVSPAACSSCFLARDAPSTYPPRCPDIFPHLISILIRVKMATTSPAGKLPLISRRTPAA